MLAMFRAHMHVLACRQLGVNDIQGEQWALNSKYNNSNYIIIIHCLNALYGYMQCGCI